jgi:hypothetical protein
MLLEPDGILATGTETSTRTDHGLLTWVDDIDVETPTEYWTAGRTPDTGANEWRLVNKTATNDTIPFEVRTSDEVVVTDLRVTGAVTTPLHLTGARTRLSGFDSADEHWVHAGQTTTDDPIVAYQRHASGDYSLVVSEGDTAETALTTGDEGSLDAGTLGGNPPGGYLHADGSVGLTGDLPVGEHRLVGPASDAIVFKASGADNFIETDGNGGGWGVWNSTTKTTHSLFREDGDFVVAEGTIYQQGTAVATQDDIGVDVENTDGTTVVSATAIQAGADLAFSDDGDTTATLAFTGDTSPSSAAVGDSATASGDGSTTTFTLAHSLGTTPDSVSVDATTTAASTDFTITGTTASDVTIEYDTAPPSGTDNLGWYVTTTASGLDAITMSNDDAVVATNPGDMNGGAGITVGADGDNTVTLTTDETVGHLTESESVGQYWLFEGGMGAAGDTDLALANASGTSQFAFSYNTTADRLEWVDRANATPIAYTDRTGTVDFQQTPQINGTDIATAEGDLANQGSGSAPAEAVPEADGDGNITWQRRSDASTATKSGDGSTTTFTFAHTLGAVPTGAHVEAESPAAMSDFYVSNKTSSDVVITYANAPPSGTDNLRFNVIVHE